MKPTDEKQLFKPTHVITNGLLVNTYVIVISQGKYKCVVMDDNGREWFVLKKFVSAITTAETTLTEQQYSILIQSITTIILNSNEEFGMGEMGEAHLIAEQTVMKWAEENNIVLPNN